jgi:hypothetical protein
MKKKQDPAEIYLQPIGQWSNEELLKASEGITKLLEDGVYLDDIKVLINGDRIDEGDEFFRSKTMLNGFIWSNKVRVELGLRLEKALLDGAVATNNASLLRKLMGDPNKISPAELAIADQMMNDTTDDGLKELEMADEADKAVEEREKLEILTADKPGYLCMLCGQNTVHENEGTLFCTSCLNKKPYETFRNGIDCFCPNCDELMENGDDGYLECPQCGLVDNTRMFGIMPKTELEVQEDSGLTEASGIDSPTPEDEKMLQEINEKATPETVQKILNPKISDEVKEKRRKQLLIAGFFLKDGQFNLEDNVFRPDVILDFSDKDFETEVTVMLKEKQEYYGRLQEKNKVNVKKPGELPRSICTNCGKYEWNKNMVDGKCPKCNGTEKTKELKSTLPLTKEETKECSHIQENKEEQSGNTTPESKMPIDTKTGTDQNSGQLKMPWE